MPDRVTNHLAGMKELAGCTVQKFGRDLTGTIDYCFNRQGFRSRVDYDFDPKYVFFGCSLVFGVGVEQDKIFSSQFDRSWNCGLAGWYTNQDIADCIVNTEKSLPSNCCKFVCWSERDNTIAQHYAAELSAKNYVQFFCGEPASYKNCYAMIPKIDTDVSGTHMGVHTHNVLAKMLCAKFDRL